ncbi:MAG: PaaI family thioesterase [Candidatus Dormibacteraeota bacterium]|nr:PaaI family thioesterase [Candidatus Dormibacteraeota bacterium]
MTQSQTHLFSPAAAWLGIEEISAGAAEAVLDLPTRAEMGNRGGVVHGGFIALLADTAMGRAMHAARPEAERMFSFDLKLNFVASGSVGERLRASARVIHAGRRTGLAECRVEAGNGRLVATATGTFMIYMPEPHAPDGPPS